MNMRWGLQCPALLQLIWDVVLAGVVPFLGLVPAPLHQCSFSRHGQLDSLLSFIHAQYWTTGVPDNGDEWRKFRVVPRSHPLRSLTLYFI